MRKSKLDSFVEVLEALVNRPLPINQLARDLNVDSTLVSQRLGFLKKNQLVEEQGKEQTVKYAVTERGREILKYLGKLAKKTALVEETLQAMAYARR